MPPECLIRADGLDLGYGPARILRGVDLAVHAGESWFLIGPNGSGKSTFLRAALGLLAPLAGRITRHPSLDASRIGYVPQRCQLSPSLPTTVREFVSLGFVGARVPRADRAAHLAFALARSGLEDLSRESYWALSGGQRQRALVARALVRRPRLMVLDEPTEELDAVSEAAFLDALFGLNAQDGTTLLFVTHELELATSRGSHLALFDGGTVTAGRRDELLAAGAVERVFAGAQVRRRIS